MMIGRRRAPRHHVTRVTHHGGTTGSRRCGVPGDGIGRRMGNSRGRREMSQSYCGLVVVSSTADVVPPRVIWPLLRHTFRQSTSGRGKRQTSGPQVWRHSSLVDGGGSGGRQIKQHLRGRPINSAIVFSEPGRHTNSGGGWARPTPSPALYRQLPVTRLNSFLLHRDRPTDLQNTSSNTCTLIQPCLQLIYSNARRYKSIYMY